MTDEEYVKSIYPLAYHHPTGMPGSHFVISRTHSLFLDFKTRARTQQESWQICAELIKKHLPDLMLEKLEQSYDR